MLAFIIGGVVVDVLRPYKSLADRERRDILRNLAATSRPHDRWVVFGSFTKTAWAPDLFDAGGSAATLRYYAPRHAPGALLWAPEPQTLAPVPGSRTFVIAYEDEEAAFPREQWLRYRDAVAARLGAPVSEAVHPTSKKERVTIVEFGR